MSGNGLGLQLTTDPCEEWLPHRHWLRLVVEGSLPVLRQRYWQTNIETIPEGLLALFTGKMESALGNWRQVSGELNGTEIVVQLAGLDVGVHVAARSVEQAETAIGTVENWLPPVQRAELGLEVPVDFWLLGAQGPRKVSRKLIMVDWDGLSENYSAATYQALENLMAWRPGASGQLIFWHGPPGTGKTYALRALLHAWRRWCKAEYVTDPDSMFVDRASYLVDVLLDSNDPPFAPNVEPLWRLLVLEDAGELVRLDAREKVGQGLSRLLNVTDGILGQGLRLLVLVTTNEEAEKLHPAVARPGRCAANVVFGGLSEPETVGWRLRRGLPARTGQSATLAELYDELAVSRGVSRTATGELRAAVGFGLR